MHLPRPHQISLMSLVVAAACKESTAPSTYAPQAAVYWIEWTATVTPSQAESLRVSGGGVSCASVVWDATVSGTQVEVTAQVHNLNVPCLNSGTGAGFDTVLVLPRLQSQSYSLFAPMADVISLSPTERFVGYFDVGGPPDTTTHFAGIVTLNLDALGCWRAQPWSASPAPRLAFAQAPPLGAPSSGRWAFLIGQLVAGSPPACGDARAISASTLEVDVTPTPQ